MGERRTPQRGKDEISFEILKHIGEISRNEKSGWTIELNLVKWGDYPPKYEIRAWSPDHSRMGKGVGLTKDELVDLRNLLDSLDLSHE